MNLIFKTFTNKQYSYYLSATNEDRCLPVHWHWPFWSQSFSLLSCCAL